MMRAQLVPLPLNIPRMPSKRYICTTPWTMPLRAGISGLRGARRRAQAAGGPGVQNVAAEMGPAGEGTRGGPWKWAHVSFREPAI